MTNIQRRRMAMMGAAKSRLPSGYRELKSIISTGTQYIQTGIQLDDYNGFEIDAKVSFRENSGLVGDKSGSTIFSWQGANVFAYWYARNTNSIGTWSRSLGERHVYRAFNGEAFFDGEYILTLTGTKQKGTQGGARIFWGYSSEKPTFANKAVSEVFSCIFLDANEALVGQFIPAVRESDNEIGMYDLCGTICPLTNTPFYINAGTGTFLKGANVL